MLQTVFVHSIYNNRTKGAEAQRRKGTTQQDALCLSFRPVVLSFAPLRPLCLSFRPGVPLHLCASVPFVSSCCAFAPLRPLCLSFRHVVPLRLCAFRPVVPLRLCASAIVTPITIVA